MAEYSLNLDWLEPGQVPVYDMPETGALIAQREGWSQRQFGQRLMLNTDVFTLAGFRQFVQSQLAEITADGHIIAVFQAYDAEFDVVIGGLAFYPSIEVPALFIHNGVSTDVVDIITLASRGIIGADVDALPEPVQAMYHRAMERREEYEAGFLQRQAKTEACNRRADALLMDVLSVEQQAEYTVQGYFHVTTRDGLLFRLNRGQSHNVELIHNGVAVISFCIVGQQYMPTSDQTVAQKLLLEACPDVFMRIANRRRLVGNVDTYYQRPDVAAPIETVLDLAV